MYQLELKIKKITISEIKNIFKIHISPNKTPGYELSTRKILEALPEKEILLLTQLFNAVTTFSFFPPQWKVTQITLFAKPGKDPVDIKSYKFAANTRRL